MNSWQGIKKILVMRLDNMGDLLMSSPAIRALKKTFDCSITLLTSSMAAGIAKYLYGVDEVIVYNAPWVKSEINDMASFYSMADLIKAKQFDGAIAFTVFSQSPFPAAMLATMAEIPKRLAYCRENPYGLLTDWLPDEEPYTLIRHQVVRDLALVSHIGASGGTEIKIDLPNHALPTLKNKFAKEKIDIDRPWILLHPGVSEKKREYPLLLWKLCVLEMMNRMDCQFIITGTEEEVEMAEEIRKSNPEKIFSLAGKLSLEEFILIIKYSPLVISVNTSTIHIASATHTKLIVLYACTNPQHTPWRTVGKLFTFPVHPGLQSKNEIVKFSRKYFCNAEPATTENIVNAVEDLLMKENNKMIAQLF
jgi:ADP-heptose:LPS heptosyltransferase